MRVRNVLFLMGAMALGQGADVARAQDPGRFVVDGDPQEWFGLNSFDTAFDVVPDTNSTVDLDSYGIGGFGGSGAFIFRFLAPPFQGSDTTTVQLFYDVSNDSAFGALVPPWPDWFRADYAFGVSGSNGALTQEFYWSWTGSAWEKKEGADIPELEVALSGEYLEGAFPVSNVGWPPSPPMVDAETGWEYARLWWAVQVSKGEYRDYLPDLSRGPYGDDRIWTDVDLQSWGEIKTR
ncbi:MAG: hypothetical protein OXG13_14675 [Gemmatimonadaceae bacterium]|nr:hypothetical protein [Gemmatimonadaceae bacterium]